MALSRKRQKELKQLKRSAEALWEEQLQTIDHATTVLRDARRQAGHYAREEVGPRVLDGYNQRVKPVVATGVAATRYAARTTKSRITDDVVPAVSSAFGSALAVLEAVRDPRVRDVVRKAAAPTVVVATKKSTGPGRYILIGLGVAAVAGIAYAAWQTLRVDEDLWIEDLGEPELADASSAAADDEDEF